MVASRVHTLDGEVRDASPVREKPINAETAEDLAQVFKTLADANRVRMVAVLADRELCVGDLAEAVDMSVSAVSHQLHLMRELAIVKSRREGRHIYYSLDDDHVATVYRVGLEHVTHAH